MTVAATPVPPVPQPSSNAFKAIVRSLMPFVYSGAAAIIARFGYHVANTTVIQIVTIAGGVLTIVLHALETQFPWIGVLLGYIGAPVYPPSTKVSQAAQIATLENQSAALLAEIALLKGTPATLGAALAAVPVAPAPLG